MGRIPVYNLADLVSSGLGFLSWVMNTAKGLGVRVTCLVLFVVRLCTQQGLLNLYHFCSPSSLCCNRLLLLGDIIKVLDGKSL